MVFSRLPAVIRAVVAGVAVPFQIDVLGGPGGQGVFLPVSSTSLQEWAVGGLAGCLTGSAGPFCGPHEQRNAKPSRYRRKASEKVGKKKRPGKRPRPLIGAGQRIRAYFLAGVLITAPISITLYLAWIFVNFVDRQVTPLIPEAYNPNTYLPFALPGLGLVIAFLAFTIIGALTAGFSAVSSCGFRRASWPGCR